MTDPERPETDPGPGGADASQDALDAALGGPTIPFGGKEMPYEKVLEVAHRGGGWFYWIAGLSLVNTISITMDLQFSMLIGLAATQFVDSIGKLISDGAESQTVGHVVTAITLVLSAGIAGFFVLLGFFAKRLWTWPYYIGLPIYALDGVLFLAFGDNLPAGFHAFVIFMLWGGLSATRALKKAEGLQAADGAMPGPSVE